MSFRHSECNRSANGAFYRSCGKSALAMVATLSLLVSACGTTKFLQEGESYVGKSNIKINNTKQVDNLSQLKYDLSSYFKQSPNRNWMGMPREWFYYKHSEPDDTTKWDKWVLNNIAEKPSIFRLDVAERTATSMENFLKNKGYFNAHVTDSTIVKNKTSKTTYWVELNDRYYFDDVRYKTKDSSLMGVIDNMRASSLLKKGAPVDGDLYKVEAKRIERQVRNLGYYDFSTAYILPLDADSSLQKVDAVLEVASPSDSTDFQIYRIGKIMVYPEYEPLRHDRFFEHDTLINGIHYLGHTSDLGIKPTVLDKAIYARPGQAFSQVDIEKTRLQLSRLGIYRFVKINIIKNDSLAQTLDYEILLPVKKRMELDGDFEFNTANNPIQSSNITSIGNSLSFDYRNRNLTKQADLFRVSSGVGMEFPLFNRNDTLGKGLNSLSANAAVELFLPRFIDLGFFKVGRLTRALSDGFYRSVVENAKSKLSLRYEYNNLVDYYKYNSINLAFGYDVSPDAQKRFTFNPTRLNFLNINVYPKFREQVLDNNEFLNRSFGNQLFTGLFFNEMTYSFGKTVGGQFGETWRYRLSTEVTGLELYLLNQLLSPKKEWIIISPLAHFVKAEAEGRYIRLFPNKGIFAARAIIGAATPFGAYSSSRGVPYVKQFFVGGPNSIRAWDVRELGPGKFESQHEFVQANYQSGDIRLEMNAEYKFDIWWLFEGALFVDMGNVWTLKDDPDRPGAAFSKDFYKQLAIGSGFGLRMDFSFFVIRLDLGYKIRYPYKLENGYWRTPNLGSDMNWNLAIGYPFY
jgi:outer membrane protein insertion porin family